MNWFHPTTSAITVLSLACLELVFLVYLLRLKRKTKDCYLIILIYLTAFPHEMNSFVIEFLDDPPIALFGLDLLFTALNMLAIIWCSYCFYRSNNLRELALVIVTYILAMGCSSYLWLKDLYVLHHVTPVNYIKIPILSGAVTLFSAINYLRKTKLFVKGREPFSFWKEVVQPSGREVALFIGFALSLFIYTLIQLIDILNVWITIFPATLVSALLYLLSVSITVVVGIVYFNYAREQTSFETKLVGITLFLTLSVISIIALIIFGPTGTPVAAPFIQVFVLMIPVTTVLILLLLPLLFRLTILKPLNKILAGVQQVISGDLNANVHLEINDEIGRLSQNFNKMTDALRQRTEQLDNMRESIATDFHDQTGNMLSAITRQAGLLKLKLGLEHELQPMIKSIVDNSNSLYASSKDFLWQLNHNSDNPNELFDYLTSQGQLFYNQFDIAFSVKAEDCKQSKLDPSSALNLIFIFKEAMTNVIKHAGATEVGLHMYLESATVIYELEDNGIWKEASTDREHYGLNNMERRCKKSGFNFSLSKQSGSTRISVSVPIVE